MSYGVSPIMIAASGSTFARASAARMMSGSGFDRSATSPDAALSMSEGAPATARSASRSFFSAEVAATPAHPPPRPPRAPPPLQRRHEAAGVVKWSQVGQVFRPEDLTAPPGDPLTERRLFG